MILDDLVKKGIIQPPSWLPANTHYLVITGSESYGANIGTSDRDLQGFCIPPKEDIFPHLRGEILDFGNQHQRFHDWQQHHCIDPDKKKEYDFAVYNIVRFFHLAMENNPNILDILNVPVRCITHITSIGQMVRDNRKIFFHAGCFHKFRGYAFSSLNKIGKRNLPALSEFCVDNNISELISFKKVADEINYRKNSNDESSDIILENIPTNELFYLKSLLTPLSANRSNAKRAETIVQHGFDTKFAMHVIRLALECEQLLLTGELDIEKDSQTLLSIR